jgi:dinuclear metal center YbgI/SA1388 family protein
MSPARAVSGRHTVADVVAALEQIAPPSLAQSWDNVGLLAGDAGRRCQRVLLTVDLSGSVAAEAVSLRRDMVVCYHPPIFKPISRLVARGQGAQPALWRVVSAGMAVYALHTALDAADGGTNDVLAGLCGLRDVRPFCDSPTRPAECKIVVFVPPKNLDEVAEAMFAAGVGWIGDYHHCSYRLHGEGTFFGTGQSSPTVGQAGRLEKVSEVRLEAICPQQRVADVVRAIRASHPYEEPAFDVYPLQAVPEPVGIGRVGRLAKPASVSALARSLAKNVPGARMETIGPAVRQVQTVAVCVGSAGRLPLEHERSRSADVFVTGEVRHHDALRFAQLGRSAIALGHWPTERPAVERLPKRLDKALAGMSIVASRTDADPFRRM